MLVKALKGFAGAVSMYAGEIKDISDTYVVNDLLNAGYIEELKETKAVETPEKAREEKPAARKKAAKKH